MGWEKTKPHLPTSIIVISAPSGSGKSTVLRRLLAAMPGLRFSVSHTTRAPRTSEKNGREYFFISPVRFRKMIAAGQFLEWARVYGNFYGTSCGQIQQARRAGKTILLDIDVQGHQQVKKRLPEAVSIYLLPPSQRELRRRLLSRHSDVAGVIEKRLAAAREEICRWPEFDYVVVNDKVERAFRAIAAIVAASPFRRENQRRAAKKICETFGG